MIHRTLAKIPTQRVRRALASRISRSSDTLCDLLDVERKLRCGACDTEVAAFVRYAGKPNLCPSCGASAKERLVLALLEAEALTIPEGGRYLHIGPSEKSLIAKFKDAGTYIAADLHPDVYDGVDVRQLDLTTLHERTDDFGHSDLVYASHILEHVPDDHAAMTSVRKSLNPGGEFWILVPLDGNVTREGTGDETIRERERNFGQWDHVRFYGDDIQARLESAGFVVSRLTIDDVPSSVVSQSGLALDDVVWRCRAN